MYIFWTVMWALAWIALITAITVFVVAAGALLISSLPAIIAAITGFITILSELYLTLSVSTFMILQASPLLMKLYESLIMFNEVSPPSGSVLPSSSFEFLAFYLIVRSNILKIVYDKLVYYRSYLHLAKFDRCARSTLNET